MILYIYIINREWKTVVPPGNEKKGPGILAILEVHPENTVAPGQSHPWKMSNDILYVIIPTHSLLISCSILPPPPQALGESIDWCSAHAPAAICDCCIVYCCLSVSLCMQPFIHDVWRATAKYCTNPRD